MPKLPFQKNSSDTNEPIAVVSSIVVGGELAFVPGFVQNRK